MRVKYSIAWKSRAWAFIALIMVGFALLLPPKDARGVSLSEDETAALATGKALAEKGAYDEAVAYFRDRLSSAEIGRSERASILHMLGYLLLYAERAEEAIENTQAAHDWALRQRLSAEAASFKAELAVQQALAQALKLRSSGDIPGSNSKFEEADRLTGKIKSPLYQLKIASAWGVNYLNSKDGQTKYLDLSLRALELADSLNYRVEASRAAKKVGTYFALKSDYSRALSYYLKALNYLGTRREGQDAIKCVNNIAGMYLSLGDYVKAKDYLLEAATRIPESATGIIETSLLVNLGYLFGDLGKRSHSEDYRQRALDCFASYLNLKGVQGGGSLRLEALAGMAGVYMDQGRLEEARGILVPALEEARKSKSSSLATGKILSLLGEASLRTGAIPEAERYYEETRSMSRQTNSPLLMMSAAYGLGRCAEARENFDRAIDSYNIALRIIGEGFSGIVSDIHRAEFIGRCREPFQTLIQLYLRLSKKENAGVYEREIFRLSEYFRARSFQEFQDRLTRDQPRQKPASEDSEEAKLSQERIGLLRTLSLGNLSRNEREQIETRIVQIDDLLDVAVFDRYGARDHSAPSSMPVPVHLLQSRVLDDRTAILEYVLGDTKSMLFCISRNSLHLIELPPARDLDDALTGFLSFLEDPSIPVAKGLPAAQRLYRTLLAPAEPFLSNRVDRLIIVPDGILFRLPFEALALPTPNTATPIYVNNRFAISYAPSASSLDSAGKTQETHFAKDALAFGVSRYPRSFSLNGESTHFSSSAILDDLYGRSGFAIEPIPRVRDEIADLARRLAPGKIDVYQGQKATESALKSLDLGSYRLIHLACHAFSDDSYPLRSALLLTPEADDQEDGYLQVSEMYNMRTNADLVVLSACQTGKGTIVMNEGNLGLPRVFFYMGAKSVLSSLWPINDKSGAVFMRNFYDAYFHGEGKAEALRTAKKAMGETRFAHPFFWASYVLTGGF
ncbi:MAG: hypothetical protein A2162_01505 [Deltaproteobacteria bacterium RBG_13_52_11b]|nr:MAG: hypothetical protein A2162_01505 [Deltaproteobacteria bacterium RBG_13_52_11b]